MGFDYPTDKVVGAGRLPLPNLVYIEKGCIPPPRALNYPPFKDYEYHGIRYQRPNSSGILKMQYHFFVGRKGFWVITLFDLIRPKTLF